MNATISNSDRLRTVADLASATQLHRESVRRAIRQGRVKTVLYGRNHRIPEDEFQRILKEGLPSVS